MGLLNALQTSVSGMNAQSSYLSAIGDNIANSGTIGYKDASTAFETVLGQQTPGSYQSGGVLARVNYGVTQQGGTQTTTSSTDLKIQGSGFFVVTNGGTGGSLLTRAGSFTPDTTGNLVNTAGYTLMGYAIDSSTGITSSTLSPVNISSSTLKAAASTGGNITGNLPSADAAGTAAAATTLTTSTTVYDKLGTAIPITLSYASSSSTANQWTVTATDANGNTDGTATVNFNPATGAFSSATDGSGTATTSLTLNIPATTDSPAGPASSTITGLALSISGLTQLASGMSAAGALDGHAPSALTSVQIGTDGTVEGVYGTSGESPIFKIPVATVTSPQNLTSLNGDVYSQTQASGTLELNTAGTGAAGTINSDSLEESTVDLATELTNMIVAQRAYEANSKVLQAASDLLSKLDNIQTG